MVERVFNRVFNEWKWITVKESGVGTMPKIIKIKHKAVKNSQIQIPDYVFDEGLTLDAIGLYIYLLSRKQKEVSLEDINNKSRDSQEHNLEILSELEQHHLIAKKLNSKANFIWKLLPVKQV